MSPAAAWRRVRNLGVDASTPAQRARQARITNGLALLGFVISLLSIPYDALVAPWWMPLEDATTAALFGLALVLSARGHLDAARLLILGVGYAVMLLNSIFMGRDSGAHLTFFALAVMPYLLYGARDSVWKVGLSLFAAACFVGMEVVGFALADAHLPRYPFPGYYAYSAAITFLILIVVVRYFVRAHLQSEDALAAREALYRQVTAAARDAIVSVDPSGRIELASPAAAMFGARADDLVGRPIDELLVVAADAGAVAAGLGRRVDGASFPVEVTVGADDAAPGRRTLIIRDVTERERERRQLDEARAQAQYGSRLAALGEMSSGVAHEINNPLTALGLAADHLRRSADGAIDAEDVRYTAARIQRITGRIDKIVSALRFFARDGDADPHVSARLAPIVDETLELCAERFRQHAIALRVEPVDPALELVCRPVQVSQVLLNLLGNAFDAVVGRPDAWVELRVTAEAGDVTLSVLDSGPGIPAAVRPRIFDPFFTTKDVGKGTGLGLSVSHGIVRAHGGSLTLADDPPTRFDVRLPRGGPGLGALPRGGLAHAPE